VVWLGFGVNHFRDLAECLGHYPWAWFDEAVWHEYRDRRVPSFLTIIVLIGAGLDNDGWSVGLVEDSAKSVIVL